MSESDLVAVTMRGGMGNQMFSYAVGLAAAKRVGSSDLRFDAQGYDVPSLRPFQLEAFGIEIARWEYRQRRARRLARTFSLGLWRPGPEILVEYHDFEPAVFEVKPPCLLHGYFQSWRYFEGAENDIRAAFDTERLSTPRIAELEARIRSAECPVAIHVRRGDYEEAAENWGLLDAAHYDRARSALSKRGTANPTYFLFSDDIPQASAMLADWDNLVPVEGLSALEDFRLMSLCHHFFIANSTFSWWAAWLGRAADKMVFAPKVWFKSVRRPVDYESRIPPEWIRV